WVFPGRRSRRQAPGSSVASSCGYKAFPGGLLLDPSDSVDRLYRMIHKDAASLIGRTPVVELSKLTQGLRGALYAKIEFVNPGASKKDRIARQMVDEAL